MSSAKTGLAVGPERRCFRCSGDVKEESVTDATLVEGVQRIAIRNLAGELSRTTFHEDPRIVKALWEQRSSEDGVHVLRDP